MMSITATAAEGKWWWGVGGGGPDGGVGG
eukprot:COSAG04_NODE_19562_length_413_cov_0.869427_1_plen_28_part_10